jgi:indole-3-glycerol phosphate synthase
VNLGFDLIGVNSRDLNTFVVRAESLLELARFIPAGTLSVAESGISSAEDIAKLRSVGFGAFLIGETLMRQPQPAATLALLLERQYVDEF